MQLLRNFTIWIYEGILYVMGLLRNFTEFGFIQGFVT